MSTALEAPDAVSRLPRQAASCARIAIRQRYLSLPPQGPGGRPSAETQHDLLEKHKELAVRMGDQALRTCLANAGANISDIDCLCCVTSTGFLVPGLSALLIRPTKIQDMRFDWDQEQAKYSFFLDPNIPYLIGANVEEAVDRLVSSAGLRRSSVRHWLIHSGGKKVIDAIMVNLRLTRHDLRHTISIMRDYGNLSSGSFLFSYERLLSEGVVRAGDYGVLVTMGPGLTIETAVIRW